MGVADRAGVLAFLKQNENPESHARRAADADGCGGRSLPGPRGNGSRAGQLGGVEGEWVRARRARGDAALLYLHGGGYAVGSPKSHRHLAAALSEASGLPLFLPAYRLAPEHPFPAAVEDALAAYQGLLDSGVSSARLAIAGDSAGGGLTFATLVAARDRGLPLPACAVAISPWADLRRGELIVRVPTRDPDGQQEGWTRWRRPISGMPMPRSPPDLSAVRRFVGIAAAADPGWHGGDAV